MPFCAHAVPKLCDEPISEHCPPVPVPKRAQSRISDPELECRAPSSCAMKVLGRSFRLADGSAGRAAGGCRWAYLRSPPSAVVRRIDRPWPERQLYEVRLTPDCDRAVSPLWRLLPFRSNSQYRPQPDIQLPRLTRTERSLAGGPRRNPASWHCRATMTG